MDDFGHKRDPFDTFLWAAIGLMMLILTGIFLVNLLAPVFWYVVVAVSAALD